MIRAVLLARVDRAAPYTDFHDFSKAAVAFVGANLRRHLLLRVRLLALVVLVVHVV